MTSKLLAALLLIAGPLAAAKPAPPAAPTSATKTAAAVPAAPSTSPSTSSGQAPAPAAAVPATPPAQAVAAPVSPSTTAAKPAEEEVEDDMKAAPAAVLDLAKADSALLAKIAEATKPEDSLVLFNLEEGLAVDKKGMGVAEVQAEGLFMELARRTLDNDKDARQALKMAIDKGDLRARGAKALAFEDRMADSAIKRIANGDKGAMADLESFAKKGNAKARAYLKMDAPKDSAAPSTTTAK